MAFEIGQVSHGYQFIEVLKSQGHGVVYKVRNQLADRLETLKALSRELQKDKERVQRFLREVKIHAHLSHPHIATFYNAFEIDGEIVMTAELVEGVSLEDLLADGPIPVFKAVEYASQTLDALEYTHANGVIHRNITPKSLVVASNGNIKVGEFELARSESDPRLTLTGMVMGPMHYISPEQVKGLEDVDGRGDVYSFGMVFYELITGRKPFDSDNQFDVMQAHVNLLPEPPSQLNTELLPEVDETLFKALAKDRQHRYQSAGEFRHALDNLLPARREAAELDGSQETPLAPVSAERVDEGAPQPALAPAAPPEEAAPPTAESAPPADDPVLNTQALDPWLVGLGVFVVIMIIGFLALVIVGPRS
jgi:serine/threonine protein kinase